MRARLTAALYSCPSPLDINKDRRRTGQGGGGGGRIEKGHATAFRTFRFPNECSCGTRRDRDEIKEKGFALMTVFVEKPPGVLFSLSLFIYLFRSSLKLNRDDIRDEFRDGVTVMPTLHHPPCYIVSDRFEYVYASIHCPVWVIACTRKNAWVTID